MWYSLKAKERLPSGGSKAGIWPVWWTCGTAKRPKKGYLREGLGLVFGQCGGHVVQLGGQAQVQNGKVTPEQERS
jgi:hypothetical protein